MQKTKKRKQISPSKPRQQTKTKAKTNNNTTIEPYPSNIRPTPQECLSIRDDLLQLDGFPLEFAKFRDNRQNPVVNELDLVDGVKKIEPCEDLSVLDGLVSTILSQNTTDVNSQRAFANLKLAFPSWGEVLAAEQKLVEDAIRCGGLAPTKASCIKNVLKCLQEKKGKLCLEYLRDLSINEIKSELSCFKGIGPKTVSCVLLFHLQKDDFPVDTHILQIAKTLGWVPQGADAKKTYIHLNLRIPKELKFDLNCLLFTHGKMCNSCSSKVAKHEKKESIKKPCPLLDYCKNSN